MQQKRNRNNIHVRLTAEQMAYLREKEEEKGKTISELIRMLIQSSLDKARSTRATKV